LHNKYVKLKRWIGVASTIIFIVVAIAITFLVCRWLSAFSREEFRDYIHSFGAWGWLVLLLLQILQVFVALIPGELLETAAGYIFGPLTGALICYVGVAVASAMVFGLTRRFGIRLVEIFVPSNKIQELRFINTEQKRNNLIFWLFFIPGTPKDLLTYFVGLTDIKLRTFLVLSLLARIPSVLSSTFGGHLLGEEKYWGAIWLYGVTGVLSLIGLLIYNSIIKTRQQKNTMK